MMRQVTHKWARLRIPGAGVTDSFEFQRGGLQGGVNTPEQFNMILQVFLADVVNVWESLDMGVHIGEQSTCCTHIIWADNIFT
eukprot:11906722-Karenia_brevis.AAC.1